MAAVLSSCSKSEIDTVSNNEGKDMILNISVSNPGADTKALIKTGWTTDDEISIWYDTNTGETPDLVITYNGTKWIQNTSASVSGSTPAEGEGKYAKALYNGTVKVASKDTYTYANNTLTFSIANWTFLTEIQVVVKDLTSVSAGSYTLACDKFTPLASTGNGYTVGSDAITASIGTKGAVVTGISNTDGVAFVFATADYSETATAFKFTLKDNTSGSAVTKVYEPNVAIAAKENKSAIKALTIAKDKFTVQCPEGFVDLGLPSGIFWAEKNLGASSATDYGNYYSWGDVTGQTPSGTTFSNPFDWAHAYFNGGKSEYNLTEFNNVKDNACPNNVLAPAYDAAYQANNSWRMPTTEDFKELYDNTTSVWTTINSVNGWKFTSKKDSNKFVFFPAAGYGDSEGLKYAGSYGRYWSSSLYMSKQNAYYLDLYSNSYFNSYYVYPQSNTPRRFGFSVRPVSD